MKLQARTVSGKNSGRSSTVSRRRGPEPLAWSVKLGIFVYLLVMAALGFGIANYRIDLNRKITDLQRQISLTKAQISEDELDIQALKLTRERLCSWDNVRSKIAAHRLQLRVQDTRQVRYFTVRQRSADPGRIISGDTRKLTVDTLTMNPR